MTRYFAMKSCPKTTRHRLLFGDGEGFEQCWIVGYWEPSEKRWMHAFGPRGKVYPVCWAKLPVPPKPGREP